MHKGHRKKTFISFETGIYTLDTFQFNGVQDNHLSVNDLLQNAINCHQSGNFSVAEQLYKRVLAINEFHPDANHNLGLLAYQFKRFELALTFIRKALTTHPNTAQYWLSFIEVLIGAGRLEDAKKQLDECIAKGFHGDAVDALLKRLNNPSQSELLHIVNLFDNARYDEAIQYLHAFIDRYSNNGFGYKSLAACLIKKNNYPEALNFARKSFELLPEDPEANNILGFSLYKTGLFDEAEIYLTRALAFKQDDIKILSNLSSLFIDTRRLSEAEQYVLKIISIQPNHAEAHKNLGNIHFLNKNHDAAITCYEKSIALDSSYWTPYNNIAVIYHKQNRIEEAISYFEKSIALCNTDDKSAVLFGLANAYYVLGNHDKSMFIAEQAVHLPINIWVLDCLALVTIFQYLRGNRDKVKEYCERSKNISLVYDKKEHSLPMYFDYLYKLTESYIPCNINISKKLYVVGESHCLSLNGAVVQIEGIDHLCESKWMLGVKAYHLGSSNDNHHKRQFDAILSECPPDSFVLLTIGEIDCRLNEGILPFYRKNKKNITLEAVIDKTVGNYINYVKKISEKYNIKIIISAVPATNIPLNSMSTVDAEGYTAMISLFNEVLRRYTLEHYGLMFLNTYDMTNAGNGISNGIWHIDMFHLTRNAYVTAFQNYLMFSSGSVKNFMEKGDI